MATTKLNQHQLIQRVTTDYLADMESVALEERAALVLSADEFEQLQAKAIFLPPVERVLMWEEVLEDYPVIRCPYCRAEECSH